MAPGTLDSLDKDDLQPLVPALLGRIDALLAQMKTLVEQNQALLARIAELEARPGQPPQPPSKSPTNSSLPPSSGQKANVADPQPAQKKQRKGRPGVTRELCPSPDAVRDIYAERWTCGTALSAAGQDIAHAYDHIDLPPIKPVSKRVSETTAPVSLSA